MIVQDNDAGPNGRVDYSITWKTLGQQHLFSINQRGEIIANEMLDRELTPQGFRFTVSFDVETFFKCPHAAVHAELMRQLIA